MRVSRGEGGEQSSTPEALLGAAAQGSPEGTARLKKPLAGLQLNKRWEESVSLEGQERWEAQQPQRGRQTDASSDRTERKEERDDPRKKKNRNKTRGRLSKMLYLWKRSHIQIIKEIN